MQKVTYFILVPMVYLSFAVFLTGIGFSLFKIWRAPNSPAPTPIYPKSKQKTIGMLLDAFLFPSILKFYPFFWFLLILFHGLLVILFLGHLELAFDASIFQIIPHEIFMGKGAVGSITILCLLFFLFRRFYSPLKNLSTPQDYFIPILLILIAIFGAAMNIARVWYGYEELNIEHYRSYLTGLITLHPDLPFEVSGTGHSFMLVIHVFLVNIFFIIFPFSGLMHSILSFSANKMRRE